MLVTLLGIVTLVRLQQPENALTPMPVTDQPLVLLGIVTAPPGPVYPVMVIVPLLVVQVNWACTTAGGVSSTNKPTKRRRACRGFMFPFGDCEPVLLLCASNGGLASPIQKPIHRLDSLWPQGNNPPAMSIIAAHAFRLSGAGVGVWSKPRVTKHRPATFVHVFLALAFVLSPPSWKCLGAESNAPPAAASQIESTNSQELLGGLLRIQEQITATRLAIEQSSQEAKLAATQNAEALAKGLQSMQVAISTDRARELEAIQSSSQAMQEANKIMLIMVGAFGAMVFLIMFIMTYIQWRTSRSLAAISAGRPAALGYGPGSTVSAPVPGNARLTQGGLVEQPNVRLLAAMEPPARRTETRPI
jgi:hypothetical protein